MQFILTLTPEEKKEMELRLKALDREVKKPLSLEEMDTLNKHRATLSFILSKLQEV